MGEERQLQERAVATRAALLDAALECLVERGYAATTTIETARRAGVSRGAQLHHFPTKADLLSAAVEHLLSRRLSEFRKAFANVDPGVDRIDAAIDLLWSMFEGPTFVAWAELWMAARTDPELARTMLAVESRFDAGSREIAAELFAGDPTVTFEEAELARDFAFVVMNGMALQRLVPHNNRPPAQLLDVLKYFARAAEETP